MTHKATFFERYGVQEYYIYELERNELSGFIRYQEQDTALEPIVDMTDWTSPRLGIRFDMSSGELHLYKPDDKPVLSYLELNAKNEHLAAKLRELGINPDTL